MVDSSNSVVQELSNKIKDLISDTSIDITVIDDISEIIGNGLYILKEIEPVAPQLKLVFKDGANYGGYLYITSDPTETSKIYLDDGETLTVDWGDGNITTYTNEDSLETEYSFATSGEHTVIFDFSNCSIPTLEQSYAFEDYRNNILEVYYPYGLTILEDLGFGYGNINIMDIPITVEEINVYLQTPQNGVIDVYWTNANDIALSSGIASGQKVRIPTGTTAIYEATNWNNDGKTIFIERGA